jgi:hypothetical protein
MVSFADQAWGSEVGARKISAWTGQLLRYLLKYVKKVEESWSSWMFVVWSNEDVDHSVGALKRPRTDVM